MVHEQRRTGRAVFLSLSHLDENRVRTRFPTIARVCADAGLDLATDLLPVSPAAHYMCGGVVTDLDGRTSVPGLYAAGEVAATGVHGANRLASNSLLEGLVFGARAAAAMQMPPASAELGRIEIAPAESPRPEEQSPAEPSEVPDLMWEGAGLVRDAGRLRRTVDRVGAVSQHLEALVGPLASRRDWEHASLALVGWLVARAALRREESRGGHRRADFPARDDLHWKIHVADRRVA
jgi:L-aspartate oxidase